MNALRTFLRLVSWGVLVFLAPSVHASEATTEIAWFFGAPKRAEYGMRQSLAGLRQQDAEAAADFDAALKNIDHQAIAGRMGAIFDQFLTPSDIAAIRRFMPTSAGRAVGLAFQTHMDPRLLQTSLSELPNPERGSAQAFLNGPEVGKIMDALRSPAAKQTLSEYGADLMCVHLGKTNRTALANAHRQGKCEGIR
jgi:hypothetical protein